MTKMVILFAFVALMCYVEAAPNPNSMSPQNFISSFFSNPMAMMDPSYIKNMKPNGNGSVMGAVMTSQTKMVKEGDKYVPKTQTSYIFNRNGEVTEGSDLN